MSVNFLHGIETIDVTDGARSIRAVKSAVIGLIGTAPTWGVRGDTTPNKIVMIKTRREAALRFGKDSHVYTIPFALSRIYDQGGAEVLVVNVFDPAVHFEDIADEAITLNAKGQGALANVDVLSVASVKSSDSLTTYAETDYTFTPEGVIRRTAASTIPAEAALLVSYRRADPSKITAADIIGGVDSLTGEYKGMKLFEIAYSLLGLFPKILIAPGFSTQRPVAQALEALAHNVRAITYIDAEVGTTPQGAIEMRGSEAPSVFQTSSGRVGLCYPHNVVYDMITDGERLEPLSQVAAGVTAEVDRAEGFWVSPSNHPINGVLRTECLLTARLNDADTDVNRLNEAGIVTIFNSFGTGYRLWGNRSAAWPSDTHPKNFICVRRTADMIAESIDFSMLPFLDRPIVKATIDAIEETVNGYLRTLIGRGALIDGKCWFDPEKNPVSEIALGHLLFSVDYMPPTPAERITFEHYMDVNMLKKLVSQSV